MCSQVAVLQANLKDEENKLQKILLDLEEAQKNCKQLQEASGKTMTRFYGWTQIAVYLISILQKFFFLEFIRSGVRVKWHDFLYKFISVPWLKTSCLISAVRNCNPLFSVSFICIFLICKIKVNRPYFPITKTGFCFYLFTEQQFELLKNLTTENESLLQKLNTAEEHCKETEVSLLRHFQWNWTCVLRFACFDWNTIASFKKNQETIAAALEQSKIQYAQIIQEKDLSLQELSRLKIQQAEKLEQLQSAIQDQNNSLAMETHRYKYFQIK